MVFFDLAGVGISNEYEGASEIIFEARNGEKRI